MASGDPTLVVVRVDPETVEWLGQVAVERGTDVNEAAEWAIAQQRAAWQGEGQQDGPAEAPARRRGKGTT